MKILLRVGAALLACLAILFLGATASFAEDCIGPDDPPGCVTPTPTPTPTETETEPEPSPTPSPTPTVTVTESVAADPQEVVLADSQWGALLLAVGFALFFSTAAFFADRGGAIRV